MDLKDNNILDALKQNSKLSVQGISKKTKLPATTVYNRIKKLERSGIIKGYTVELDYKKLGLSLSAYILITVDYKLLNKLNFTQNQLAEEIKNLDFVHSVDIIAGGADILTKIRVRDIDELGDLVTQKLRNVKGVENTQTLIVLASV